MERIREARYSAKSLLGLENKFRIDLRGKLTATDRIIVGVGRDETRDHVS